METKVISVLQDYNTAAREGAKIIRSGGLVAFPTETVYGLGADGLDGAAVDRIFEAKGRPNDNPLILHVAEKEAAFRLWVAEPPRARALMDTFWPGPLTLIYYRSDMVPDEVTAGLDTVAVRMPDNQAARALIAASGVPIAAPSANLSGKPSPTTAAHVLQDMEGRIPLILDGGPCRYGVESTVLSLVGTPTILRPGAVTKEMLAAVLGEVALAPSILASTTPPTPRSSWWWGRPRPLQRAFRPSTTSSPPRASAPISPPQRRPCPSTAPAAAPF